MSVLKSIPSYSDADNVTGCCPKFYPERWDRKFFDFSDMKFVKAVSKSFMHMPIDLGKVMTKVQTAIDDSEAQAQNQYLILSKDLSAFKSVHYFMVEKDVKGFNLEKVKGTFCARVFEGNFNEIPNWFKEIEAEWTSKGKTIQEQFVFYTTCPKCAKTYGHNYIVIFTR